MRPTILHLALAAVLCHAALATTYYVSPTGNDSLSGLSTVAPWKTITKANATLSAGDTVYLMAGTYAQAIAPASSGSSGSPITYIAYPGQAVTISGVTDGVDLRNRSYITVDGLTLDGVTNYWVNLRGDAESNHAHHNIIQNCYFDHSPAWAGIYIMGANYNTILDCVFVGHSDAQYCGPDDLIYIYKDGSYNRIEGCLFQDAPHTCIELQGRGDGVVYYNIIRGNVITNKFHTGLNVYTNSDYTLVEGNSIYSCGVICDADGCPDNLCGSDDDRGSNGLVDRQRAIQWGSSSGIVRRNVFYDSGIGIDIATYASDQANSNDNYIYHNTFFDNYHALFSNCDGVMTGNVYKNNILSESRTQEIRRTVGTGSADYYIGNNILGAIIRWDPLGGTKTVSQLETALPTYWSSNLTVDPCFVDSESHVFSLSQDSDLIDAGQFLTTTVGADTGTTITVEDARYFFDGYGITGQVGDTIQLEGQSVTATITEIDGNDITVDTSLTWTNGLGVALAFGGDGPDVGAIEDDTATSSTDFGLWTEVEMDGNYLTRGDTTVAAASLPTNVTSFVGKDFGEGYFTDVTFKFTFVGTAATHTNLSNHLGVLAIGNVWGNWTANGASGFSVVFSRASTGYVLMMRHSYNSTVTSSWASGDTTISASTTYYCTVTRDQNGGANGAGLYKLYICTGSHYDDEGSLVDEQTLTVPAGGLDSYRYAFVGQSRSGGASTITASGTIGALTITAGPPVAPTEAPDQVTGPSPAHQATGVATNVTLTWSAAEGAENYIVNFGQGSLSEIGAQTTRTYSPAGLAAGTDYMWRIDANNAVDSTEGDVWTFTTAGAYEPNDFGQTEDFTQWTIVNPMGELAVTDANTITATALGADHSAHVSRNFGSEYFSGDLSIRWQATVTDAENLGFLGLFAMANSANNFAGWSFAGADAQVVYFRYMYSELRCYLDVMDDGGWSGDYVVLDFDEDYYFQLDRDDDGGDNNTGLLTLYVSTTNYHGESGAVDVNDVSWSVPAGEQNAFSHAVTAYTKSNNGTIPSITGTISYLDLAAGEPTYDPPGKATGPYPASAASNVSTSVALTWNAATGADNYNVYFGTPGSLSLIGNQTARAYSPSSLENDTTYAWRIDPNNAYGTTQGDVWTFSTGAAPVAGNSLTQHGITWTFDQPLALTPTSGYYTYGQFANGDYWVVGPVVVLVISPSGATQNGSMLNVATNTVQGFDSRAYNWSAASNVATSLPLTIPAGSSLISTRSNAEVVNVSYVNAASILTVLATAPAEGAFRPPYFGTNKAIPGYSSQLNYELLRKLSAVSSTPSLSTVAQWFEGPWLDFLRTWVGRSIHPSSHMPSYGRDLSTQIGIAGLMLNLNYTNEQKETLAIRLTQLGIDLYGIASHPNGRNTWPPEGGHAMGRKFPILFAGAMLDHAGMLAIGEKSGAYLWSAKTGGGFYGPGDVPPDYIYFGEDGQTFFIDQFMCDLELVTSVSGPSLGATSTTITIDNLPKWSGQPEHQYVEITSGPGAGQTRWITGSNFNRSVGGVTTLTITPAWSTTPVTGQSYYHLNGYEESNIGTAEWGVLHADYPEKSLPSWGSDYRYTATIAFPGWILASHFMGLVQAWNHEALFEWTDRWMTASLPGGSSPQTTPTNDPFITNMWVAYRDNIPDAPTNPPSAPFNPIPADAATDLVIDTSLRWEGIADSWTIYLGESPDALVYQDAVTIKLYQPSGLQYATTYYWQVVATNDYGSTSSSIWSFTTAADAADLPGVPGSPQPLHGATNVYTEVNLSWGAATNAQIYNLYLGSTTLDFVTSTTSRIIPVTLATGTRYYWRVDAVGMGGTTTGTVWQFTTYTPSDQDDPGEPGGPGTPTIPDYPSTGWRVAPPATQTEREDRATVRYAAQQEALAAVEWTSPDGEPNSYVIDPMLAGYLERIVILPEGTDEQWSLTITDSWGGELFSATDLDMTEGVVSYDGQRLPFVGGLIVSIGETTAETAERIRLRLYLTETWRR